MKIKKSKITDKQMLDWIQKGHGVVCLSNKKVKSGKTFCANFEKQNWDEHEDVREAIKVAMKEEILKTYLTQSGQPS